MRLELSIFTPTTAGNVSADSLAGVADLWTSGPRSSVVDVFF